MDSILEDNASCRTCEDGQKKYAVRASGAEGHSNPHVQRGPQHERPQPVQSPAPPDRQNTREYPVSPLSLRSTLLYTSSLHHLLLAPRCLRWPGGSPHPHSAFSRANDALPNCYCVRRSVRGLVARVVLKGQLPFSVLPLVLPVIDKDESLTASVTKWGDSRGQGSSPL